MPDAPPSPPSPPLAHADPGELLAWDTRFFGFPVARAKHETLTEETAARLDGWCRRNGVRCLYFQCRSDDPVSPAVAEDNGYRLVDVRMTYARPAAPVSAPATPSTHPPSPTHPAPLPESSSTPRPASPADVPALRRMASTSHRDTRFYSDAHFPRPLCDALYARWIQASCEGFADAVLVIGPAGAPLGYVTCHLDPPPPGRPAPAEARDAHDHPPRGGRIGLIAVGEDARGRGLGPLLVRAAVDWLGGHGAAAVSVVTQGRNVAAQRLYQRCGFLTRDLHLYYHKWFDAPAPAGGSSRSS